MFRWLLSCFFITSVFFSYASHVMGGEITWRCQGNAYVFQLVFYRDCNGAEVNTVSENIRVWNHQTITSITVNFVSRTDISPTCNPVAGSPPPLDCGSGNSGGNGIGAIEKIIYESNPINLNGTPGAQGWIFTYENFSRSNSITNISNPGNYGITIAAKMYAIPNNLSTNCVDNSPVFLQEPYFVSCAGTPFKYNMNAVDPDLDSLAITFGIPYNNFPTGTYDPPNNPIPVPFETGFSFLNPTPDVNINVSNVAATIHPSSGEINFTSFTTGNYVVKALVKAYRAGVLIAEVEREMQLVVVPCNSNNNPPIINPPFGASFETIVNAGDLVNFNITSTDIELLQDGSPQNNLLTASGQIFGTGYTSTSGCAIQPCATLNTAPIISGVQGVSTTFNWQTDCDHLVGVNGVAMDTIPYHFVFRVQDDYCQVPKVSYATVTIKVANPGVIQAPNINCIQQDGLGNTTITWTPVADPSGTFVQYDFYSTQNGLLASETNINDNSITIPGINSQQDFFIAVVSGCNGNTTRYSDTLTSIFLNLNNPSNGTAVLDWNEPSTPPLPGMNGFYHIYREYPTGTWTLIDSVPYGISNYLDTIDICNAFLNYQIVLENTACNFTSNIEGDNFEDMITPNIPIINYVSIDTATSNVVINWNQNQQSDTYGYVVYTFDANGFIYELDTVWGINNTTYIHNTNSDLGALSYSVAAFDSCFTPAIPPTYQTSAKAIVNRSVFLQSSLDICDEKVTLRWSNYEGWNDLEKYEILSSENGQTWTFVGTTTGLTFVVDVNILSQYCFVVRAISLSNDTAYSNRRCLTIAPPNQPSYNYLQVATVSNNLVDLKLLVDAASGVQTAIIQKMNSDGTFKAIATLPVTSDNLSFTDTDVDVNQYSYTYKVVLVDSCGHYTTASNLAKTILLVIQKDDVERKTYINWNAYLDFNGSVNSYSVFKGIDGNFDPTPIATITSNQRSIEDLINIENYSGKVCYYVEANEGSNIYNDPQISRSNIACIVFEPLIYIPNSFSPDGDQINECFYPEVSDFEINSYQFVIFDRWGQEIFHTNDPNEHWCGYIKNSNEFAETATYVYMLTINDGGGNQINKRGHVTLLK